MKRIPVAVRRKAKKIKLLLLDVDGVLTDGRIIIDDRGVETKQFHVRDGQGISLLLRSGVDVGFMTARSSKVVSRRAKELGVRIVRQGVQNKLDAYHAIRANAGLSDDQIAYMGDDVIDLCGAASGWFGDYRERRLARSHTRGGFCYGFSGWKRRCQRGCRNLVSRPG